ncbi:MAG: hypothetical protein V2B20_22310, partial [Pseudomonadota bacterium]
KAGVLLDLVVCLGFSPLTYIVPLFARDTVLIDYFGLTFNQYGVPLFSSITKQAEVPSFLSSTLPCRKWDCRKQRSI